MKRVSCSILAILILAMAVSSYAGSAQGTMNVSATIVSTAGKCTIQNIDILNFPTLNPTNPVDVTASAGVTVKCTKVPMTFDITLDNGLYYNGSNRMENISNPSYHVPYSLTGTSYTVDIKHNPATVYVTGTILGSDYRTAYLGNYSDTVILTLAY